MSSETRLSWRLGRLFINSIPSLSELAAHHFQCRKSFSRVKNKSTRPYMKDAIHVAPITPRAPPVSCHYWRGREFEADEFCFLFPTWKRGKDVGKRKKIHISCDFRFSLSAVATRTCVQLSQRILAGSYRWQFRVL